MVRSTRNFIESSVNQTLVKGGASSSQTLNDMFDRLRLDILALDKTAATVEREVQLANSYLNMMGPAIQALANHLTALIPTAPSGRGRFDFFSDVFSGTSQIDTYYGQGTLPIKSTEDKILYTDTNGDSWAPDDARIRFFVSNTYNSAIPSDDTFMGNVEDYRAFSGGVNNFMLGSYVTGESYLYLKLLVPNGLNTSTLLNRIQCTILPVFTHSLVGAWVRRNDGQWVEQTYDYIPGYSSGVASLVGPLQLHLTPTECSQICLVFKVSGWWGVKNYSAQLVEYATTGDITVDFAEYSPGTIRSTALYGYDQIGLTRITPVISGTSVTVPLSQASAYTSPILTGIEARWS